MDTSDPTKPARRTASTPVGAGTVIAEVFVPAELRPGDELVAQRVDTPAGPVLRLAYRRADRILRGPVSVTLAEGRALRRAVEDRSEFTDILLF
jgi:hypothetical protein